MERVNCKAVYLATALLALLQIQASQAQDDAKQWLKRMLQTARTLNYEGTFVYVQGPHLEAMRIIHSSSETEGERQRMFSLNGPHREVVVVNQQVICLLPQQQQTALSSSDYKRSLFPISLPQELDGLEEHYRFEMLGDDRTAGLETRIIAIQPRDELRYGYRLWLEHKTGMVLRSVLMDEKGHTLEQMLFTHLEVKPQIDAAALEPTTAVPKQPPDTGVSASEQVLHSDWMLTGLPRGFTKVMHTRFAKSAGTHPTEHIVLTDGLATVSVFLESLQDAKPLLEGASQLGAMNAFGRVAHQHQILVVGEVPQATVQTIANSVHSAKETTAR